MSTVKRMRQLEEGSTRSTRSHPAPAQQQQAPPPAIQVTGKPPTSRPAEKKTTSPGAKAAEEGDDQAPKYVRIEGVSLY